MMSETTESITLQPDHPASQQPPSLFTPDVSMMIWTWVTFLTLLAILYKFAWKPILEALHMREETIRRSLEEAEQAHQELQRVSVEKQKILTEAQKTASDIIDQSRKNAQDLAIEIEAKAKEHSRALVDSAEQQIEGERLKLKNALTKESVDLAVAMAGKILQENADTEKNRKLIDQYIKDL